MVFELWKGGKKGKDYKFYDRTIKSMFTAGGLGIWIHKYIGPYQQAADPDNPDEMILEPDGGLDETSIQDVLLLENRDRKYDPDVYVLKGVYNVQDGEFDLRQFGLFLDNDIIYVSFHYNDMIEKLGRKIMPGDVFEMLNLRDNDLLGSSASVNKFYQVEDTSRSAEGFSPTWFYHIWRCKCKPLTNSQEFADILGQPDPNAVPTQITDGADGSDAAPDSTIPIGADISNYSTLISITDGVLAQAAAEVPFRNFEIAQFYVVPSEQLGEQYPWIYGGSSQPPNRAQRAGSGNSFPQNPTPGTWFLRTDYTPYALYQFNDNRWTRQCVDWRRNWESANRILTSFINNGNTTYIPGELPQPERQYLSSVVRPRADFGNDRAEDDPNFNPQGPSTEDLIP